MSYNPNAGGGGGGSVADGSINTAKLGGDVTTVGKALLDAADVATQRTRLGLGAGATQAIRTGSASFTIAPAKFGTAEVTVSDANATPGRVCLPMLVPNVDYDADDLEGHSIAAVCAAGSITFTVSYPGPIVGAFSVTYLLTGA